MKQSGWFLKRVILVVSVLVLMVGSFAVGNVTGYSARAATAAEEPPEFSVFWEAWDLVVNHFVDRDKIDFTNMTYGAIQGMLDSLGDTGHTTFLSPQALEQHQSSLEGAFEGIGAYVSMEDEAVTIVAPIDGSPAEAAGILAGDVILAVDGDSVVGLPLSQVIDKIRGPAGTAVTLTVLHPDAKESVDIAITRRKIELDSVTWSLIPGTPIAYVQISQFAADTGDELEKTLKEIDATQVEGEHVQGIVLDLRNNPGGFLREALRVGSQFLPRGETILQEEDARQQITTFKSRGWGYARDIPLVVLINQGTASAGEITAGALQENDRAQLIGETTFGTGTVLNQYNLSDGSAILLGVTNWLTPDGNLIKGQGITPDIVLPQKSDVTLVDARTLSESTKGDVAKVKDEQFLLALDKLQSSLQGEVHFAMPQKLPMR